MALPPCGLYRTTSEVAGIPSGRLVYFHNHGNPGAGLYLPRGWTLNRADWNPRGHTLPNDDAARNLVRLPPEGLYAVKETFFCCERRCAQYAANQLVQLGYDGGATPLLFIPELSGRGLGFPDRGNRLEESQLAHLQLLTVASATEAEPSTERFVH